MPSRDATAEKTERKKTWLQRFGRALDATACDTPLLLLGDLNVVEPDHTPPHLGQFAPFEYAFYTDLTRRHGLLDLYRHLHPDTVEPAAPSWATATTKPMAPPPSPTRSPPATTSTTLGNPPTTEPGSPTTPHSPRA